MKILIVDDEQDILELMAEEFIDLGHEIELAICGNEAIEKLKSSHFDIVLSDYMMPNGNGLTLLTYINSLAKKPIFFFASGYSEISQDECLARGASYFFTKPFCFTEVSQKIEHFFNTRKLAE